MKMPATSLSLTALLLLLSTDAFAEGGILLEVTGGKAEVSDWVSEATLELATMRKILGVSGGSDGVAVYELDASGSPAARVAAQVDEAEGEGLYTVAWRVPGKLAPGEKRRFLVSFSESGEGVEEEPVLGVQSDEDTATVTNGPIVIEHVKDIGGMIHRISVDNATAVLSWADKIFDGEVHYLANHRAERMDVRARGPLRAAVRTEGAYTGGKGPASKPRAVYRFTTYAGLPFTLVQADVTQDFAHPWKSLHFIEIQIGDAGFTHLATDQGTGALRQAGESHSGREWAAVYNGKVLIATCASMGPAVWDGGGSHYGAYLKSGTAPMSTLRHAWKGAIFYGAGAQALEEGLVQRWSDILAAPPAVRICCPALEEQVVGVETTLKEKESALASLSGREWAANHVAVTLARVQAGIAREKLGSGEFGAALAAIKSCEETLGAQAVDGELIEKGTLQAGMILGHPFLANDRCAYVLSKPKDGAGIMSIYDRRNGREMLKVDPAQAPLWEIAIKKGKGGTSYQSKETPCDVSFDADEQEGRLHLRWSRGLAAEVEARLPAGESLLRARIMASTTTDTTGLVTVTFPVISGVMPITPEAEEDRVLETWGLGWKKPSPLVSGKISSTSYPNGLQFSAITGNGRGFYVAEEDGEANRKQLSWIPNTGTGTLGFSISHPVLNWGADEPVHEYESPGDFVCGPFEGDWYDAARIYRKWALTAPWCAKGPIYERDDYPKWLLTAPYWTLAYLQDEWNVQNALDMHTFYDIPVMVAHTYGYYFASQEDRTPELWPPKLGSERLRNAVRQLQERGIRVVPYVLGWVWDEDTESFRTRDARNKGALWGPDGALTTTTSYGGGQRLTGMCPASKLWREVILDLVQELVGRYGADGIYFDFLTNHTSDCYNKDHGHAICGGDYWTKAVHGFYEEARTLAKSLNPDAMITGEGVAEHCIDVHDTFLVMGKTGTSAALFPAVYHGYANIYGAKMNEFGAIFLGRFWLLGCQNGWHNTEWHMIGKPPNENYAVWGEYYRRLLKYRWEFATPYLGYGEMLRPPSIEGDLPTFTEKDSYSTFTVQAVEGSAWKAPDGTVGIFFLNYDEKESHEFTWTTDVAEIAELDESTALTMSRWTLEKGLNTLKAVNGGVIKETMTIKPLGIIALKLEAAQ